MTPGQLGRAGRTVLAVPCIYLDTRVPQPSPTLWDFSEFNIGGFPVSQALSVCWLHKAMEGKRTWPWEANERARSASTSPFPNCFCKQHLEQKRLCTDWLCQSPQPLNRPGLRGAPHSCTSRKGLTGSAWRLQPQKPIVLQQSPPPHPGRPCGEPHQKAQAGVSGLLASL